MATATKTRKTRKTPAAPDMEAMFAQWAASNPDKVAAMAKTIRTKKRAELSEPGLHPDTPSESERNRNMVAKCSFTKHVKTGKETVTIHVKAAIVRTDDETGCRISASVGGIFGVQGDTFPGDTIADAVKLAAIAEAEKANAMPEILKYLRAEWDAKYQSVTYRRKQK